METLTHEMSYSKEERDIIHEAEDLISEFKKEQNEENDPKDNELLKTITMSKTINLEDWLANNEVEKNSLLFLSEKQVRSFPGFENVTHEEIVSIINTLHHLSLITYELISLELSTKNEKRRIA